MSRIATLCLVTLTSCVTHHRIDVTGAALGHEVVTIREHGSASVAVEERRDDQTFVTRETIRIDQTIGADDERHLVRDLIANCPGDNCALTAMWNLPMKVREFETRSAKPVIYGTIGGIVLGGAVATVVCGIACDEGTTAKTAANYAAIAYGVALAGVITWIIVSCARGTCHD